MAGGILIHYMINGGFLRAGGEANRDNNYILDHVDRLKEIPVHIVHGRYDRVCHLYQAEALVRALRAVGNNEVNYFITMAGRDDGRDPRIRHAGRRRTTDDGGRWGARSPSRRESSQLDAQFEG
jgi:hypothetical protein